MDNQIKKFYDSESVGGGSWQKMYEDAQKEITRLNSKLAALQPSTLPLIEIKTKEQIFNKWKGQTSQAEHFSINDAALCAMEEYASQLKNIPLVDNDERVKKMLETEPVNFYLVNILRTLSPENMKILSDSLIERLPKSVPLIDKGEPEVIEFAEWLRLNNIVTFGGFWKSDDKLYDSEELVKLFKNSKQ